MSLWDDITHGAQRAANDVSSGVHNFFHNNNPGSIYGGIAGMTAGGIFGVGALSKAGGDFWNSLTQSASLQTAGPAPTQAQAVQSSLSQELQQEKAMRSTWSILTGSGGLLESPNTAPRTMMGI